MSDILTSLGLGETDFYAEIIKENLDDRILVFNDDVSDCVIENYILYILKWNREDKDLPVEKRKPITIYINSPGGDAISGFNMVNIILASATPIKGIVFGMAASMGAFLLSSGAKGKRFALPNSEIMIHQPLGGARGQATEIKIVADHILKTREKLNRILAENTGRSIEEIARDTERDNYLTAQEAMEYGLVDKVIAKR